MADNHSRLERRAEAAQGKMLGPIKDKDQHLRKDEPLRTLRGCVAIVTSVGCSFSGSHLLHAGHVLGSGCHDNPNHPSQSHSEIERARTETLNRGRTEQRVGRC